MCRDDSFCRCHIEDAERKRHIKWAIKLLEKNGYKVEKSIKWEKCLGCEELTTSKLCDECKEFLKKRSN